MTRSNKLAHYLIKIFLISLPYLPLILILLSKSLAAQCVTSGTIQHVMVTASTILFLRVDAFLLMMIGIVLISQMNDERQQLLLHSIVGYTLSFVSLVC